jgi:hypothetical protein
LTFTTLLAVGPVSEYDNTADSDPAAIAAVLTTRFCPDTPTADLAPTALSDVHTVVSQTLPPKRTQPLSAAPPTLEPSTVTLAAAVVGVLVAARLLESAPVYVSAPDTLPVARPAVTPAARTLPAPLLDLVVTLLSEVHAVCPDTLPPNRS